jgi:large subunit ribosomal protein L20
MPRTKGGNKRLLRRKKIMKLAKGFHGKRGTAHKIAKQSVMKALYNAYIGRKLKKRDFRRLWIVRINAACRQREVRYGEFMGGLKKANINLNRKMLADLAVRDASAFDQLVEQAKAAA